jgi:hypothetical protein
VPYKHWRAYRFWQLTDPNNVREKVKSIISFEKKEEIYGEQFLRELGIEVDEAEVRKAAENGHRWRNPDWTHKDGSLAEW